MLVQGSAYDFLKLFSKIVKNMLQYIRKDDNTIVDIRADL